MFDKIVDLHPLKKYQVSRIKYQENSHIMVPLS
jgi:hypothetical protein